MRGRLLSSTRVLRLAPCSCSSLAANSKC
jgi:hypothetical protein